MNLFDERDEPMETGIVGTESLNVAVIRIGRTEIGLEVIGDQILVLEDKFKSGYECSKCDGERYLEEVCDFCGGKGKENIATENERPCRMCCPADMFISGVVQPGKKICNLCNGKGAVIIAPQTSQRKPTSGVIISVGPDVYPDNRVINLVTGVRWAYPMRIGDRVLYSQFAGTGIELKQKDFIRIMHAHEVMSKIHGVGKLGDFIK